MIRKTLQTLCDLVIFFAAAWIVYQTFRASEIESAPPPPSPARPIIEPPQQPLQLLNPYRLCLQEVYRAR